MLANVHLIRESLGFAGSVEKYRKRDCATHTGPGCMDAATITGGGCEGIDLVLGDPIPVADAQLGSQPIAKPLDSGDGEHRASLERRA
jgi:hypothetical protein